jgi:hypothetical protein
MSWAFVQGAQSNSAGAAGQIAKQFTGVNTLYNILFVVVEWIGTTPLYSGPGGPLDDEQGTNYWQLGSTASQTTGAGQINTAIFWGIVYQPDTVGFTVTVQFQDPTATNRYIAIAEFNPGTLFSLSVVDGPSVAELSLPAQSPPLINTVLANIGELLIVGVYTQGRTQTTSPGWISLGSDAGGQGAYYQIMSALSGPYAASPCTTTGTPGVAIVCAAFNAVSPNNIPSPQTPIYAPLLAPPLQPAPGSPVYSSLGQLMMELVEGEENPSFIDWNGNGYTANQLVQGPASLLATPVEYNPSLGSITYSPNRQNVGLMYQRAQPLIFAPQLNYFVLGGSGIPMDPSIVVNPRFAGHSLRSNWNTLEPAQGQFNFSFFDSEIARAVAAGKMVILRVLVEGSNAPNWVYNISQWATFSTGKLWIYWDPAGLAAKINMLQQLGARYANIPNLQVVAAACDTDKTGDWGIPHSSSDIALWSSLGYSTQLNIQTCITVLNAYYSAFPNQIITLALGRNGNLDATPDTVSEACSDYMISFMGERGAAQKNQANCGTALPPYNTLNETNFTSLERVMGKMTIAMQPTWFNYQDPTYRNNAGFPANPANMLSEVIAITKVFCAKNPYARPSSNRLYRGWLETYWQDAQEQAFPNLHV